MSDVVGVQLHAPLEAAVVTQMDVPPSTTVTTLPASAVPLMVGVVSFVIPPDAGLLTVGAFGTVVSTVTITGVDVGLVLPAMSICIAVST